MYKGKIEKEIIKKERKWWHTDVYMQKVFRESFLQRKIVMYAKELCSFVWGYNKREKKYTIHFSLCFTSIKWTKDCKTNFYQNEKRN